MNNVDFLRPQRASLLAVLLLLTGVGAMVVTWSATSHWQLARDQAAEASKLRIDRAEQLRRLAQRPQEPSSAQRRRKAAMAELEAPWFPTLRLIETSTAPPVHLLAFVIDPDKATIRVEGEAPDFSAAVEYAAQLNEPGLTEQAQLLSHEVVSVPGAGFVVRFVASARWVRP